MNNLSRANILEQNMAHPDFPDMGLGSVVYVKKSFARQQFVYTLIAADGKILLKEEDKLTVQNYIIEYNLELMPIH